MLESLTASTRSAKKTRQRKRLIGAMLQQPSLERAAESVGISRVTAWRIQQTPEFQQEYRQALRAAVSQCRARLQQASSAAANTLLKIMVDPQASAATRMQAADRVLKHANEAQLEDVEVRLERVEQIVEEKGEDLMSITDPETPILPNRI